jgi:hypothetical protein
VIGLAFFNALLFVAGCGLLGAVGWWRGWSSLRRSVGSSYLAGVAMFGVVAQLLYVCGASLARWQVVAICAVAACGIARAIRGPSVSTGRASAPAIWRFGALGVCGMLALVAVDLWFQPLWAYDAWTFWTPKAHALWALGGLDAKWFSQANLISKDYPLLLPAVEAAGFRFTGYETALLDLQSFLFFAAFLRSIYELAGNRARPVVLWAVLTMLAVSPSATDQLAAAEADIPVAVLFATAGAFGAVWLRDGRLAALVVAALLAAGAAATKVEGFLFTVGLFLVLALLGGRRSWKRGRQAVVAGLAAVLVGIVPWRIWLALHHIPNQGSLSRAVNFDYLVGHVGRLPVVVLYLLLKALDPRAWLFVVPLFGVVLVATRKGRNDQLFSYALAIVFVTFLGLVLVYWSSPLDLHYQLATSARRVVTGVIFFCAAMTPVLSERIWVGSVEGLGMAERAP